MKFLYILALATLPLALSSQGFITTWETTSDNQEITIPTSGGGYDYTVDWGDGNIISGYNGYAVHTYSIAGIYQVEITGTFPRIRFQSISGSSDIISVDQWGANPWTSMSGAFYNCTNLVYNATDTPDLSGVDNMSYMFAEAIDFNGDLNDWDVSNVTTMSYLFEGASKFNGNVSDWDVSSVTTMREIFKDADEFNQDISDWDVSAVTNMREMFRDADEFNQEIENWDVSNVTTFERMFEDAADFNGDIGGWDVSNATTMEYMFHDAASFNQDIGGWDVSNVTNMYAMFYDATPFNQDLGGWDVSNVTNMGWLFAYLFVFNQDLNDWDVSNVIEMNKMFFNSPNFNGDISGWDVSNVETMENMFYNAESFNQDIGSWDTGNVDDMGWMFRFATTFNQDIGAWDTGNVELMDAMFNEADAFDQDLGGWDVSNVENMSLMFRDITLSTPNYDALLIGWSAQDLNFAVYFDGGDSEYCLGESARQSMIDDYFWSITDDGLQSGCNPSAPSCTSLTIPLDGSTDVDITTDIEWTLVTGATGYDLSIGTTSGGVDILDNFDVGNVSSYSPSSDLPCASTIYVSIVPYNASGSAVDCIEESFDTEFVVADAGLDVSVCNGSTTQLNGSGGSTYSWSPAASLDNPNIANPIATPTTTTTYTSTVTNANGCTDTDNVIVTVNDLPIVTLSGTLDICAGTSTVLQTPNTGTYLWSTGETTQSITVTPLVTSMYSVTVTDANACSGSAQAQVTVNDTPTVTTSATETIICEGETTTIQSSSTGGASPYSYNWDNGLGSGDTFNVQPTEDTVYSVTVTDGNGCTDTELIEVLVNPIPQPDITGDLSICIGDISELDAGDYESYIWNTGDITQDIIVVPIVDTNFAVTVTDNNGCSNSTSVIVEVNALLAVDISGNLEICEGASTILQTSNSGSYLWSTGETTQSIAVGPLVTTTYSLTVTDSNSCSGTDQVEVIVNDSPTLTTSVSESSICLGQSTTLQASATGGVSPYVFNWDNGLGLGDTFTVQPIDDTVYTVTVTDGNGCTQIDFIEVFVNPLPVPLIAGELSICDGESSELDAGIFDTYVWSIGESTQEIIVDPNVPTDYSVTVTDENGCSGSTTVTVEVFTVPLVEITGTLEICEGESSILQTGNSGSHLWSTGESTSSITISPLVNTSYSVTVTDANFCTNTDEVIVVVYSSPIVTASVTLMNICEGESTTLQASAVGGIDPYLYNWDNDLGAGDTFTVEPLEDTTYTVTVTDSNGCSDTDFVDVLVSSVPQASISGDLSICIGESTELDSGGVGSFLWSTGEISQIITVDPIVSTEYSVTVTSTDGCTNSDSATVTVVNSEDLVIEGDINICEGDSTILSVGDYDMYLWNTGETSQSIIINPQVSSIYSVTVTESNSCSNSGEVEVVVNEATSVIASATEMNICTGQSTIIQASATGGMEPHTFNWDNGLGSGSTFTVQPVEDTAYTVTVTDMNGCTATDMVQIVVNPFSQPAIVGDLSICFGESTVLDAGDFDTYLWNTGDATQTIEVQPTSDTEYSVIVTNNNGCVGTDSVTVSVLAQTPLVISGDLSICPSESTLLEVGDFDSYLWSTGEVTQSITVSPENDNYFSVSVTDMNGCVISDSVFMVVNPLPAVSISGDLSICTGASTTLDAGEFSSYLWSTGDQTQTIEVNPISTSEYFVTVTDLNGCSNETQAVVQVIETPTPNIIGNLTICANESTALFVDSYPSIEWSTGETGQSINVSPETSTEYSVTVTDSNNCTGSQSVTVEVSQIITPIIEGSTILCDEGSTLLTLSEVYSAYLWSTGATEPVIEVFNPGIYSVTVTDEVGCTDSASIEILDGANNNSIQITQDGPLCNFGMTVLTAQLGFESYSWNTGSTESQIEISEPGLYEVAVISSDGCSGSGQIEVIQSEIEYAVYTSDETCVGLCDGQITIEADPSYTVIWDDGLTQFSQDGLCPGDYPVQIFNEDGCSITLIIEVEPSPNFEAEILSSNSILIAQAIGGIAPFDYLWSTGDTTQIIDFEPGTIEVTLTDANGCVASDQLVLSSTEEIEQHELQLYPNPASSKITINIEGMSISNSLFKIYNLAGGLIEDGVLVGENLDVVNLPEGVYFLEIHILNLTYFEKFIIVR